MQYNTIQYNTKVRYLGIIRRHFHFISTKSADYCVNPFSFILAVFISLLLQDLMMKRQVFHCTWRHMLLTVEKKALSALPLLHRHCRTTDYQIMCVRATHNKHVTGQSIINHSIINLKRIWYIWRLY